ncbi:MAG: class I SAM-dependent methyltransferase [Pseudomonadota bacterium]
MLICCARVATRGPIFWLAALKEAMVLNLRRQRVAGAPSAAWFLIAVACAGPPDAPPEGVLEVAPAAVTPVDWTRSAEELALRDSPFRFERDPATGLVRALEMGVEGAVADGDWPLAFVQVHPELFGPAEALVEAGEGRWTQRFAGVDVLGSLLTASVNAEGRFVIVADLARPPEQPPPAAGTEASAIDAARRWLPSSELSSLDVAISEASPVWFDPGLLAPPSRGLRPCWRIRRAGSLGSAAGEGSAEVIVDAVDLTVLGAWDRRSAPSQTWSALMSYVPPRGLSRPGFDAALAALELSTGERVADIGAGSGALSWPLSQAVGPGGLVYATDVDPAAIAFMRWRLDEDAPAHPNVDVRLVFLDDPRLPPASVDAILLWEAHFFMQQQPDSALRAYLAALHDALRPGGRVVVIETTANGPESLARANFEAAGFSWLRTLPGFPGSIAAVLGP